MTNKEMTEIFSVMLLAWPNAEVFKGGIAKLGPTIKLWTACTAEVDTWTGQQAVIRLCKKSKFPPTIAEFLEQVNEIDREIHFLTDQVFHQIRDAESLYGSIAAYYEQLPSGDFAREVIDTMGGPDALIISYEANGYQTSKWNLQGIESACGTVIRRQPTLVGGKAPTLAKKKQLEGT